MSASRRLPNFSALRAFEAAARHENFSRAADELRLTHGAISHQVRALEEDLGRPLFVRHGRQVKITHEALQFAQVLGKTFDAIGAAADALRPAAGAVAPLTLAAPAWFAARWLTPRLGGFIELHPEIDLVLHTRTPLADLARAGVDAAIVFDLGRHPGMVVERLMDEVRYRVVSAHCADNALASVSEALQGGELLRAVLAGEGEALMHHVVAAPELAAGRLARQPGAAQACAEAYYLVSPPGVAERPQVAALRRWLHDEVAAFQRQLLT
ncbi:LysR family glycine cleavage system transcriptional activator [Duganella sp. 3397]|uniref:LysR substrate-binding domain-containing protein n=1 Tax=Duganella sp. 3397 TaxID=2817732 RepID=UPI00285AD0BD|nr:LysR family transcriptional regulator [Duganella sp. 3397]MDR7047771.1 LysR family glycine cleavage system transcriptional activator [Duganella sp. 3397]